MLDDGFGHVLQTNYCQYAIYIYLSNNVINGGWQVITLDDSEPYCNTRYDIGTCEKKRSSLKVVD